ncbi:MAG: flagellar hook-basal body protein [Deltaproteobacteria bacterium]|nr:flagellar hook-basal body protein [Deltaproteobacteria bacterium]
MGKGIYVATSGSIAQLRHMEVLSNNLANVRTAGFKGDRVTFEEVIARATERGNPQDAPAAPDGGEAAKHFAVARSSPPDMAPGPLTRTDNPLDLAVTGNAMLQVQTERGVRLTRGGQLMLGRDGAIRTSEGHLVLSQAGKGIVLPPDTLPEIDPTGAISADGIELGQLGMAFVDPEGPMDKDEDGLFVPPQGRFQPSADASVMQGHVEESNVSPVRMMLDLVEVQRLFSALRQVISTSGEMDAQASRLARG